MMPPERAGRQKPRFARLWRMAQERVHALDDAARELFARKGEEGGPDVPQKGEAYRR
jgi:hypothetical protein